MKRFLNYIRPLVTAGFQEVQQRVIHWTKPFSASLLLGTSADLVRSKAQLVAENALLRQQLIILRRHVKRPTCTNADRRVLVLLARVLRTWKLALFIVQPETLLRWHRHGFCLLWKYQSLAVSPKPRISAETVTLIKEMAEQNRRLRR